MEVDEAPELSPSTNCHAEKLWRAINDPLIGIFSDLGPATIRALRSLLDSMIGGSHNLVIVLIPLFGTGEKYEMLQRQHTAYAKWLFGTLFHVVGAPLSAEVTSSSIDVQALMLRILAALNLEIFDAIAEEYIHIFDELLDKAESDDANSQLVIKRFVADQEVIENLDLRPFPVTIEASAITATQISLMKIIIKTGVNCWQQLNVWERVLRSLEKSEPGAKIVALEIASEMLKNSGLKGKNIQILLGYAIEIVKTIPSWRVHGMLNDEELKRFVSVTRELVNNLTESPDVTDFCFAIVDLIAERVVTDEKLELATCEKLREYLTMHPRAYSSAEEKKFLRYFQRCKAFSKVLVHFIVFDVRFPGRGVEVIRISDVSPLWKSLLTIFEDNLKREQFNEVDKILRVSSCLSVWLDNNGMQGARIYDDSEDFVIRKLRDCLENINCREIQGIYQCLVELMSHEEVNRSEIQRILSLPWSQEPVALAEGSRRLAATAKSLGVETKAHAVRAIAEFGKGRERLSLLSACVSSNEIDLSVAGVTNSLFLLKDTEITLAEINTHILRPAIVSQRPKLQEAIAKVLGKILCYVSGRAKFHRDNWDSPSLQIECDLCDRISVESATPSSEIIVKGTKKEIETIFSGYFNLLSSTNLEVRKIMSTNLHSFSNHLDAFGTKKNTNCWLPLIKDSCQEIRETVARAIETIVRNKIRTLENNSDTNLHEFSPEFVEYVDCVMNFMAETFENAVENANDSLHCTIITTAMEFGRIPLPLTERRLANIFLITILHPNSTNTAISTASVAYHEFVSFQKVTPKEMYVRYKKNFLELMMRIAVSNFIEKSYNLATTLHRVAKCIGYRGSRQLLSKDGQIAICYLTSLVVRCPEAINLFHDLSESTMMDEKEMFTEYFQHICAHVFLNEPPEFGTKCLKLVSDITRMKIKDLMTGSFMGIFRELVLHFHEKMEIVIRCLEVLSDFDGNPHVTFETNENVAEYLMPRLHAILVHFDSNLSTRTDEHTQKSALASLGALMRFMGAKYLTPLRYKILATLTVSLGFKRPGFRDLSCYAWNSFLHNVSLQDLGPLLPTICVSLLQLLETCRREAEAMLDYLLVENLESMSPYIPELFFIDDMNVSSRIAKIVKDEIAKSSPASVEDNLKLWLRRITRETDEVRKKALTHLKKYLSQHRSKLNEMILAGTEVHPLIVELLDALLAGCQDKDENIRVDCGECLGELGAIEPSLLPRRIVARDDSEFIADMGDDFARAILMMLVRAFQVQKNTTSMGCLSLAIQEILKTYGISPTDRNKEIWEDLPSTTQQIIFPFLESHYIMRKANDEIEYPHPIYGSESGSTFQTWAYNWVGSMSKFIEEPNISGMLTACRPAFNYDTKTMIFFIPYIVSHIVATGTERQRKMLIEEILAVINAGGVSSLDEELLRRRPLRHDYDDKPSETRVSDEARRVRCSQVIFSTLDHLQRWLGEKRLERDEHYCRVDDFFNCLDSLVLAQGCYQYHEYHRALMYLERHMASTKKGPADPTEGSLLAKIYTQLEEPDGVSGILATQDQSPTLQQLVLAHEVAGQLQDAATCYERLAQRSITPKYLQGMIQCYLGLDQPFTAMNITKGVLNDRPELEPLMMDHEPFWRLAHYSHLDDDAQGQVNVKRSLLEDLKKGKMPDLQPIKKRLVSLLWASSQPGAYQQSYSYIMKLHILNEFEKAASLMLKNVDGMSKIIEEWDARGRLVKASRGIELVLGMRRATLDLAVQLQKETGKPESPELKEEIGMIWLKSSKIARKAGMYQQAYMYILTASDSCPIEQLSIEQAQLYWDRNRQEEALATLKRCLETCFLPARQYYDMPLGLRSNERRQCAKAKLLFAKYNHHTLNVVSELNVANYDSAIKVWPCWEKTAICCAQYFDSVIDKMSEADKDSVQYRNMLYHSIQFYGKSLGYGCKYVHQSMPRMLTAWFDYTARVQTNRKPSRESLHAAEKMMKIISGYTESLPIFVWLTALSQLVSRICHPSPEVQLVLNTIIVRLILAYPQHCLWMMASVFNSSYKERQKRSSDILEHQRLDAPRMRKLVKDFNRLWLRLIELSNRTVPQGTSSTTVTKLSHTLPKLLRSPGFGPIMMPTSKFRELHMPSKGENHRNHNPFPTTWTSITGIEEQVMIMPSLQRPRRISLRGSDGVPYLFMCKPKDDLRRDFRLMEFNGIVNKYLQKDPESRQRRLYIRTYSVVPLNEECGLIEWVPNLAGLRPVLMGLYKERGLGLSNNQIKASVCDVKDPLEKKRRVFLNKILPKHPPVLGDWFRLTFPDSYAWYEARAGYIRTTAVMSMVGYILGLGDRHGENILLDTKCGDSVHVDFNCLFNRGEQFDWPERVPFRLTHNMVEAMGPLKCEGPFRHACQTTMRVLRQQSSILMSILTPFVYDPLVSWTTNDPPNPREPVEKTNEKVAECIMNIQKRLSGLRKPQGKDNGFELNLSVEGQTNLLIIEATNIDNLCQMYFGWGPYL